MSAHGPLLEVDDVSMAFGGVLAVDRLSFDVPRDRISAIIGPNGAGKTTVFNIVSGLYRPSGGRIRLAGDDVTGSAPDALAAKGLSRTFQNLQIFFRMSALDNVMVGRHLRERHSLLPQLLGLPSMRRQNAASEAEARAMLAFVGLGRQADRPAGSLPYGALKRLEIARALAAEPTLLLLDEPAAGCNGAEKQEIERLTREIAARGVTVVLVEHDMRLVMRVSDHIIVLDHGRKLAEGTADQVRGDPEVIRAYLGSHGQAEASRARG